MQSCTKSQSSSEKSHNCRFWNQLQLRCGNRRGQRSGFGSLIILWGFSTLHFLWNLKLSLKVASPKGVRFFKSFPSKKCNPAMTRWGGVYRSYFTIAVCAKCLAAFLFCFLTFHAYLLWFFTLVASSTIHQTWNEKFSEIFPAKFPHSTWNSLK